MINPQNTVINHRPNLFRFGASTLSWIGFVKSPHHLHFMNFFQCHDRRRKRIKVIKAQANRITSSWIAGKKL